MSRYGRCAIVVFLVVAAHAEAATNQWTRVGPRGGMVTGLSFDGAVAQAYATTAGGFFRSTDGGSSWQAGGDGLRDAHLQALVAAGGTLYVGGADGVSRSDDRGLHFQRLDNAPTLVTALAAGAGRAPLLFAAGAIDGAFRSDDGGATWKEINEGLERDQTHPAAVIFAILIDPRQPNLVWAGSEGGVYRSLDGGAHWTRTSSGLSCFVTALAIDSRNTLYAGCLVDPALPAPAPPPLFVSSDLGLTWHASAHGLVARGVTALLADPSGAVWAGTQDDGVFRTANHGRSWSRAGSGTQGQAIGALAQAPRRPSLLLAGGGLALLGGQTGEGPGVFRTTSSGLSWAVSSTGPHATSILAVAADAVTPRLLVAADNFAGLYRSRAGGVPWRGFGAGLPAAASIRQVEGDTALSGELYAAASIDGTAALFQQGPDPSAPWRRSTSVPATCSGPLTAGARGQLFLGSFGGQGGGVCVSDDGGATWTVGGVGVIGAVAIASIAVAPSTAARVYAAGVPAPLGASASTFFRSDDGGATWAGESAITTSAAHGLAVDPLDADLVYAATPAGVELSRDGGLTWELILPGHAALVRVDPRAPSTLYAAPGPQTVGTIPPPAEPLVSVSDDGGVTWTSLADGLPPNVPVLDLAFDAASSSILYAATAGGGVCSIERTSYTEP
jgi:hypothetical protein